MNPPILTFAVPCYNSAAYLDKCVQSLLAGGDEVEIILVDDGSEKDDTPALCDRYAAQYANVRAIHQPNGGHGEAVNTGLQNARGRYFKVVDSDDWLDEGALLRVLERLRGETALDMLVCNYVYEHAEDGTRKVVRYRNVFPAGRVFTWRTMRRFRPSQFLLMHSVIYRTELLRACGLALPAHTFYVDNLFVYQPLPFVETICYLDVDLYRYFIGRSDQSVNEQVMCARVEQQVRVTRLMLEAHDLRKVLKHQRKLGKYLLSYLSMMMTISSVFLIMDGSPEKLGLRTELWERLRAMDPGIYRHMKYRAVSAVGCFPGYQGRKLSLRLYRVARRLYKFN